MRTFITLFLVLGFQLHGKAQDSVQVSTTGLKELYGDVVPGRSVQFNSVLTSSLILRDTKAEEWPELRSRIYKRITSAWGVSPVPYQPVVNKFEETGRYVNLGLTHIRYRFHVLDDIWVEAVCVLPKDFKETTQYQTILAVHGTNGAIGKDGALGNPKNRSYAIELAQKGFVTVAADLYGYGASLKNTTQEQVYKSFYDKYPKWSIRGIQMLTLMRGVDMLEQLKFVKKGAYGSIGNSLGGGSILYHTVVDNRIKTAIVSTGVSPLYTNIYRIMGRGKIDEPLRAEKVAKDGIPPYETHEAIALCAPRAVLFLEPFNDPYNPDNMAVYKAVYDASAVYKLLGTPNRISILVHGDGHDTIDNVRDYAYKWLERFLMIGK